MPLGQRIVVYVVDSRNRAIRMIEPDGTVSTLGGSTPGAPRVFSPTRLAWHRSGWLFVKDGSVAGVTAVRGPA